MQRIIDPRWQALERLTLRLEGILRPLSFRDRAEVPKAIKDFVESGVTAGELHQLQATPDMLGELSAFQATATTLFRARPQFFSPTARGEAELQLWLNQGRVAVCRVALGLPIEEVQPEETASTN